MLNFLLENWLLVLAAVASGGLLLWPSLRAGAAKGLSTSEAVALLNREKGVLIDVSEPTEFAQLHANGARNVPFGQIESAGSALPKNKAVPVVVLCPTGARAARAVAELRKIGFERAQALTGGTAAWREANLPVERSAAVSGA
jgi:rhodanese-related sulfurtransferase